MARVPWLAAGFVAAFFAVGIPHWTLAYSDVSLPNTLIGPGLLLVVVVAALVRSLGRQRFILSLAVVGLAVPAAVLARVVVETAQDPTSHNLWPIEIFIASFVGLFAAAAGALIGRILSPVLAKR
jgi:hypothetical protein